MGDYKAMSIIIIVFTSILVLYGIYIISVKEGFHGGRGGGRGGRGRGGGPWRNYGGSYGGSGGGWSYGYPYGWHYGWPFNYSEYCYKDLDGIVRCDRPKPSFYVIYN
jgi:hypothetical protein